MPEKKRSLSEIFSIFVMAPFFVTGAITSISVALFPILMVLSWIRWKLWMWFAVPYLHVPIVPYWAMVGLGLLVSSFMPFIQKQDDETKNFTDALAVNMIVHLSSLGIGYLIYIYAH